MIITNAKLYIRFVIQNAYKMIAVVNTRLPKHIVKWIDELVENEVYKSRSEAIRDFLRDYAINEREKDIND